jgi:hypothetical protein
MDKTIIVALIGGGTAAVVSGVFSIIMFSLNRKAQKMDRTEDYGARLSAHDAALKETNEELQLLTYGILACLKGLKEQGCNGPVTDAVNKIEKHLNEKAHGG